MLTAFRIEYNNGEVREQNMAATVTLEQAAEYFGRAVFVRENFATGKEIAYRAVSIQMLEPQESEIIYFSK